MGNCVTTLGYAGAEVARWIAVTAATLLKQLVAVAEFALSAQDAIDNFKKLWDISSRGLAIEEAEHGHLTGTYWPAENQFMGEFTQSTPWESQATLAQRYSGRMWAAIAGVYAKKLKELEVNKSRYHGRAYTHAVQELLVSRGLTKANVITLADKIAFAEVQAVSDRDFTRRQSAVVMRKALVGQAAALMRSAAEGYAAAGSEAMASANSALQQIGYNFGEMFSSGNDFHRRALASASSMQRSNGGGRQLGSAGNLGATTGWEANVSDAGDTLESYDAMRDLSDAEMTVIPTTWRGSNVNDVQGAVQGGEGQDLARGGTVLMNSWNGTNFQLNMMSVDLVDVSNFKTDYLQDGPPGLPGPASGTTVTYIDMAASQG